MNLFGTGTFSNSNSLAAVHGTHPPRRRTSKTQDCLRAGLTIFGVVTNDTCRPGGPEHARGAWKARLLGFAADAAASLRMSDELESGGGLLFLAGTSCSEKSGMGAAGGLKAETFFLTRTLVGERPPAQRQSQRPSTRGQARRRTATRTGRMAAKGCCRCTRISDADDCLCSTCLLSGNFEIIGFLTRSLGFSEQSSIEQLRRK